MADILDSTKRRRSANHSRLVVSVASAVALVVMVAVVAVALTRDKRSKLPTLPGWPAVGAEAQDSELRTQAWQAWAKRDPSVTLEQTATLFAAHWLEGQRTVVVLAAQNTSGIQIAVVLVNGQQAERFSSRRLDTGTRFITEVIAANGQTVVLALAPGMTSATLTTATVGAPRAQEKATPGVGGVLLPVPRGQTATRVVLEGEHRLVIADRVPGADSNPQTPPVPLIVNESVEGGRQVQIRSDGAGVTCRVVLADSESGAPALVDCPAT